MPAATDTKNVVEVVMLSHFTISSITFKGWLTAKRINTLLANEFNKTKTKKKRKNVSNKFHYFVRFGSIHPY